LQCERATFFEKAPKDRGRLHAFVADSMKHVARHSRAEERGRRRHQRHHGRGRDLQDYRLALAGALHGGRRRWPPGRPNPSSGAPIPTSSLPPAHAGIKHWSQSISLTWQRMTSSRWLGTSTPNVMRAPPVKFGCHQAALEDRTRNDNASIPIPRQPEQRARDYEPRRLLLPREKGAHLREPSRNSSPVWVITGVITSMAGV